MSATGIPVPMLAWPDVVRVPPGGARAVVARSLFRQAVSRSQNFSCLCRKKYWLPYSLTFPH